MATHQRKISCKSLKNKRRLSNAPIFLPYPETGEYDEHGIDLSLKGIRFFCERYGKTKMLDRDIVSSYI